LVPGLVTLKFVVVATFNQLAGEPEADGIFPGTGAFGTGFSYSFFGHAMRSPKYCLIPARAEPILRALLRES